MRTGRFHFGQPLGAASAAIRRTARSGTSLSSHAMRNTPCLPGSPGQLIDGGARSATTAFQPAAAADDRAERFALRDRSAASPRYPVQGRSSHPAARTCAKMRASRVARDAPIAIRWSAPSTRTGRSAPTLRTPRPRVGAIAARSSTKSAITCADALRRTDWLEQPARYLRHLKRHHRRRAARPHARAPGRAASRWKAEPSRKRTARHGVEVTDPFQPEPGGSHQRGRLEPQRCDWQPRHRRSFASRPEGRT
jgi:hypothetical protein